MSKSHYIQYLINLNKIEELYQLFNKDYKEDLKQFDKITDLNNFIKSTFDFTDRFITEYKNIINTTNPLINKLIEQKKYLI